MADGQFAQVSENIGDLTFDELIDKYGLTHGYKPKSLRPNHSSKFLPDLASSYNVSDDRRITPDVIKKKITKHILNILKTNTPMIQVPHL